MPGSVNTPGGHAALQEFLQRVLRAPSPFYAPRLRALGIDAARITDDPTIAPRAWTSVPLTSRQELLRDQRDHLPHGSVRPLAAAAPVRAGVTGSGDDLLVLAWSAADLAHERAAGARLLTRLGIQAGMRVANTLAGALAVPGSLLLGDVIEEIGALDIPLGVPGTDGAARQAWELIERVQPDVLILETDTAPRLLAAPPNHARDWWKGIVWLQRATRVDPPSVPEGTGFTGWQRTWLAVPEVSSFIAGTCAARNFHIDPGVHAEIVDDRLVLTALEAETPVLRYATDLRAHAAGAPCSCGTDGMVIELLA